MRSLISPYPSVPFDFNSRTPCGVRLDIANKRATKTVFQLMYPLRGTTTAAPALVGGGSISTHVPLAGYDLRDEWIQDSTTHFNSRTPCGVRLGCLQTAKGWEDFNSRTPHGVRRERTCNPPCPRTISTHAPRAGCDLGLQTVFPKIFIKCFNSRTPIRGATSIDEFGAD